MTDRCDLIVIGAGPAGMSAAITATGLGLSVVVFDEQTEPGGQIYRGLERLAGSDGKRQRVAALGDSYGRGIDLLRGFRACGAEFRSNTTVWQIDGADVYSTSASGTSTTTSGKQIVIATGAVERATPFPGWTLPGVMTCGAAQILLKTAGMVPEGRVVLAGSGPLLFMLAWQLLNLGVKVGTILETTSHKNYAKTLIRSIGAVRYQKYLRLGFAILGDLRGADIPIVGDVSDLRVHGEDRATEISYRHNKVAAREHINWLFVHEGVVPNLNLWLSTRAGMAWNNAQRSFQPRRGRWGDLSIPTMFAIGDCAHIGGADAAATEGQIAAFAAAANLNRISASERDRLVRPQRRVLRRERAARAFLDRLYEPAAAVRAPRDEATIICRCEEVTTGELREAVALGCTGPNQLKAFTRCGMGPCQGRLCGPTVVETIADARGLSPEQIGYYRVRPPIKPVTVGDIARSATASAAVGRP